MNACSQAQVGVHLGDPVYSAAALRKLFGGPDGYLTYISARADLLNDGAGILHRLPRHNAQLYMECHGLVEGPGWLRGALVGILEKGGYMRLAYSDKLVAGLAASETADSGDYTMSAEEAIQEIIKLKEIYVNCPTVVESTI